MAATFWFGAMMFDFRFMISHDCRFSHDRLLRVSVASIAMGLTGLSEREAVGERRGTTGFEGIRRVSDIERIKNYDKNREES